MNIIDALSSLVPAAQWALRGDELEWLDTEQTQPTDLEIQAEIARLTYIDGIQQYQKDRAYPNLAEQLDQIYHEGVDAWKVTIASVKTAHPKVLPVDADQQAAVDTHVAEYTFAKQLADYRVAVARLAQYIVADGRTEVIESQSTGEQVWDEDAMEMFDVMHDVITVTAIEPVEATVTRTVYSEDDPMAEPTEETIENPLITTDVAERADAQAVVDGTPAAVVEAA